jgi:hypothetical protein
MSAFGSRCQTVTGEGQEDCSELHCELAVALQLLVCISAINPIATLTRDSSFHYSSQMQRASNTAMFSRSI